MPAAGQAKLLRVIQDGEFDRLGDEQPTRVDVRIVASTNSDLDGEVKAGPLPGRPLLPAERRADRRAAAARAQATTSASWRGSFAEEIVGAPGPPRPRDRPGDRSPACGPTPGRATCASCGT